MPCNVQATEKPEEEWAVKPIVIVPRAEWGAEPPKATTPMVHPVHKVIFTFHTDVPVCTKKEDCIMAMQVIQGRHMKVEGRDDIKYNFLVGGDGLVYEGRGFHSQPCTSLEYPEHNGDRLDIAFLGDYSGYKDLSDKLAITGYDVALKGIREGYVVEFYEYYEVESPPPIPDKPYMDESLEAQIKRAGITVIPESETPIGTPS